MNWSLMSALSGPIYMAPTLLGISSVKRVRIGKNAASVLPEAVEAPQQHVAVGVEHGVARRHLHGSQRFPAILIDEILNEGRIAVKYVHTVTLYFKFSKFFLNIFLVDLRSCVFKALRAEQLRHGQSGILERYIQQLDKVADDLARGNIFIRPYPAVLYLDKGYELLLPEGALVARKARSGYPPASR